MPETAAPPLTDAQAEALLQKAHGLLTAGAAAAGYTAVPSWVTTLLEDLLSLLQSGGCGGAATAAASAEAAWQACQPEAQGGQPVLSELRMIRRERQAGLPHPQAAGYAAVYALQQVTKAEAVSMATITV